MAKTTLENINKTFRKKKKRKATNNKHKLQWLMNKANK